MGELLCLCVFFGWLQVGVLFLVYVVWITGFGSCRWGFEKYMLIMGLGAVV